jgi:hypothetical protein
MTSSSSPITSIARTMEDVEYTKIWLEFWSKIISSLAWPLLILFLLIIVFCNRKKISEKIPEISALVRRTTSVKFGNASISFSENLAKIEEDKNDTDGDDMKVYKISDEGLSYTTYYPNFDDIIPKWFSTKTAFHKLAVLRPDFAILDSWQSIERLLQTEAVMLSRKSSTVPNILNYIAGEEKISSSELHFIKELYSLRNQVIHNGDVQLSYSDAEVYRKNCLEAFEILVNSIDWEIS